MKYIRTKDGIYYVPSLRFQNPSKCECEHGLIIKHANTIEELCDQFLIFDENNEFLIANNNFSVIKDIWNRRENRIIYVYGEIWVNNELHKVAKMNDKGELELL